MSKIKIITEELNNLKASNMLGIDELIDLIDEEIKAGRILEGNKLKVNTSKYSNMRLVFREGHPLDAGSIIIGIESEPPYKIIKVTEEYIKYIKSL